MIRSASRLIMIASGIVMLPAMVMSDGAEAPYPEGYRHWTHIKSAYIGEGSAAFKRFGGMHHIYANREAMEGYRTGRFPPGSVLVFDLLDASSSDKGVEPGARKFVDIMWKNPSPAGGWVFGEFDRDSRTVRNVTAAQGVAQCQSCHDKAGATDGVFSKFTP